MPDLKKIKEYVEDHREEMIDTLKTVITQESYHGAVDEVQKTVELFQKLFEESGFTCQLVDVGTPKSAKLLTGVWNGDAPEKAVIFSGHMDTIHPLGSFPEPFTIENEKVHGPGVLDMKGGIVVALYACRALQYAGFRKRPLKICFLPDEENYHIDSKATDILTEYCRGAACLLNMETGLPNGGLCVSRKGKSEFRVTVEGHAAHTGNDFDKGRNAIEELARKIIEIQELTNRESGTTLCVDTISGGNLMGSFPGEASATFDLRATSLEKMEKTKQAIREICQRTYIDGTKTELSSIMNMVPFECTEGVMELYHKVHDILKRDGFGDFPAVHLGGSSDASCGVIAGIPTLCSCGIQGE